MSDAPQRKGVWFRAVARNAFDELVLLALAGISTGVVVAGVGSRLAMLALRGCGHG